MEFSEKRDEIFKALAQFRVNVEQPKKEATNPFFKSKYVVLEGVCDAIDKAIEGLGLSYIQEATSEGNQASVTTHVLHESGQYISFDKLNVPVSKNDAQAFGSALTYAKRYSLSAAFGITSDIDDDGNSATENPTSDTPVNSKTKMASSKQVGLLKVKVNEYCTLKKGDKATFESFLSEQYKVDSIYETTSAIISNIIKFVSEQIEKA